MAAARNLPMPEMVKTITIDSMFTPVPQGIIVNQGDQVTFQNNSGADITIQFQANPPGSAVYNNNGNMNLSVGNGAASSFTAPSANASANYYIYSGAIQESGPYVIQVGTGPMYVQLTENSGVVTYTPQTVAVPLGNITTGMGMLNIGPNLPSNSFNIAFPTQPFNPAITAPGGTHPVRTGTNTGPYDYTAAAPSPRAVGGGGKVIIQN